MAKLTLISHHLCPYVQRVAIALAERGVAFERVYIDLAAKPDWFVALSPLGKVPLLQVGDDVLFESSVICEYLEDTLPEPLHPADPLERARHRGWMELGSSVLADIWSLEIAQDAAGVERATADLRTKLARVEAQLGDGPYFSGARFSLVDAVFAPAFRYFELFDQLVDLRIFGPLPRVRTWRAALAERPSVRDAVPADYHTRLLGFLHGKQAYLATPQLAHSA
ncbi:MAG TPA: glutathione S-transferase family protein [Kofleriaceae bacterium]|nr:glutathione S-transferase family protein [Kofleriaceae bacterium]